MTAEALFQRACSLGVASGCTNRAAGMLRAAGTSDHRLDQCAAATFAKACELEDPWACTMYASHLVRGAGVNKDAKLALRVLEKSCKYGKDDPACENAMQIREEILKTSGAEAEP